jgi:carbon storage regulator
VIDHDIRVSVVSVRGERVRLGISAPKLVQVDREEIHKRRAEANAAADPLEVVPADSSMVNGRPFCPEPLL